MADGNGKGLVSMTKKGLRSLISVIASRAQYISSINKTYKGARDMYEVLGYPTILNYTLFYEMYQRGNIAGRIVDAPAQATWSNLPTLKSETKKLQKVWIRLEKRLKILAKLDRADKLAGIGQFSILLLGVNDGKKMDDPIGTNIKRLEDVLYLTPYSEDAVSILETDSNPASPRFGKPSVYGLTPFQNVETSAKGMEMRVHWSRVIHIAEGLLENELYGQPRLRRVFNLFLDLAKVVGGSAEFFWRIADRGIQFDLDPEADLDEEEEAALDDEIDEYIHGLKRSIKTRGITAKVLGSETSDPRGSFTSIISLISGATGIPQRILLGSEQGKLAGSQDKASWGERIVERRRTFAEPVMLRPLIDKFMEIGVFKEEDYEVIWPDADPQSKEEQSVIANRLSSAALNHSKQLSSLTPVMSAEEFRDSIGLEGPPPEAIPEASLVQNPNLSRTGGEAEEAETRDMPEEDQSINK